ncbi:hypothetical protein [Winogradskyella sp. UBA3174]|uniref:hypothetical protein n=1 Tax=Winogradskyella sp. UBA3174 TaxID=1947785 RepID=UPI0025D4329D|nr:hypothetical protein [Winogradskyella sp. UBA3174]|tara:strand:- start:7819 stop:8067 length:249 start_codon:yes stop_codon:yes gene_type:complete
MTIVKANIDHLEHIVPLFNAYRSFYRQKTDKEGAEKFLIERFQKKDAILFIAYIENDAVGFIQLYPLLSSVSMKSMYLLNAL